MALALYDDGIVSEKLKAFGVCSRAISIELALGIAYIFPCWKHACV